MAPRKNDVVLVTGASGFLGRHLLKELERDATVSEIRALDKVPLLDYTTINQTSKIKIIVNDLLDVEASRNAFRNTDVVIHCAALVSYEFPPNLEELQKNNVNVTENVIRLCIEENVEHLVHCSTTEVTLRSYVRGGIFGIVIYQQESRIGLPENESRLMMGAYAVSKLRAEKIVLEADGKLLASGEKRLRTVSIRPTLLYGDGDTKFIYKILKYGKTRGNTLPRLAGEGGKQQMTYVGNAAWALVCAKNTLRVQPDSIAGLPITITDDSNVNDIIRFCGRITKGTRHHVKPTSWWILLPFSYLIALLIEFLMKINSKFCKKLPVSPTAMVAYMGSVFVYNRARASITLDYSPIYSAEESIELARRYYLSLMDE